jgi:hypothetical protein
MLATAKIAGVHLKGPSGRAWSEAFWMSLILRITLKVTGCRLHNSSPHAPLGCHKALQRAQTKGADAVQHMTTSTHHLPVWTNRHTYIESSSRSRSIPNSCLRRNEELARFRCGGGVVRAAQLPLGGSTTADICAGTNSAQHGET